MSFARQQIILGYTGHHNIPKLSYTTRTQTNKQLPCEWKKQVDSLQKLFCQVCLDLPWSSLLLFFFSSIFLMTAPLRLHWYKNIAGYSPLDDHTMLWGFCTACIVCIRQIPSVSSSYYKLIINSYKNEIVMYQPRVC